MPSNYRRVNRDQRCQIEALKDIGISVLEISLRLKVHRSTIYRELRRNKCKSGQYKAPWADALSARRRKSCAKKRIFSDPELAQRLKAALTNELSPDLISGTLGLSSHQTIYNELRIHRRDLRCLLLRYNRRSGRKRKNRQASREKPSWMLSIHERPEDVERRERLGDWERDTVLVKDREMILVCLERRSRFVRLAKLNKRSYKNVAAKTRHLISIGKQTPLTITNDNGTEFMDSGKTGVPTYYCDPYSPQQRGSVENVIGKLRRYLTHQTDINLLTRQDLKKLEDRFNHRPRKVLGYLTPHEVLYQTRVALGS